MFMLFVSQPLNLVLKGHQIYLFKVGNILSSIFKPTSNQCFDFVNKAMWYTFLMY